MKTLPSSVWLFAAQGVLGLGSYVLLVAAGQAMDETQFAAFAVFWSVVFSLGLGLFGPLEASLFRLAALGDGFAQWVEVSRLRRWYLAAAMVFGLGAAIFLWWSTGTQTSSAWWLAGAGLCYFLVLRVLAIQRGVSAGIGSYTNYSRQVGADGFARVVLAGVLLWAGVATAGVWALAIVAAGIIGAAVGGRWKMRAQPPATGPAPAAWRRSLRDVLVLTCGTTVSVVLSNSLPAVAATVGAAGQMLADFSAMVLVTRIPMFFAGLGLALVVPAVSRSMDSAITLRAMNTRVALSAAIVCGMVFVALLVATRPAMALAFGVEAMVDHKLILLMAWSTAALLFVLVVQGIPIGMGQMGFIAYIWMMALAGGLVTLVAVHSEPPLRVATASAVSALVAVVVWMHSMWLLNRRKVEHHDTTLVYLPPQTDL